MRKTSPSIATAIIAAIAGATFLAFAGPLVSRVQAAPEDHPVIQTAINATKDAITDLKEAPTDFHGHRADAIKALHAAIKELQICAKSDKSGKSDKSDPIHQTLASYPRIEAAQTALKNADTYIKNAPHDFNGHRADAEKAVENAISELDVCLKNG